jgi:hypothetical protein
MTPRIPGFPVRCIGSFPAHTEPFLPAVAEILDGAVRPDVPLIAYLLWGGWANERRYAVLCVLSLIAGSN